MVDHSQMLSTMVYVNCPRSLFTIDKHCQAWAVSISKIMADHSHSNIFNHGLCPLSQIMVDHSQTFSTMFWSMSIVADHGSPWSNIINHGLFQLSKIMVDHRQTMSSMGYCPRSWFDHSQTLLTNWSMSIVQDHGLTIVKHG